VADLLPKRDVIVVSDETTRQQFAVMLTAVCFRAKREVPKVGSDERPTPWDCAHERINALLDDMDLLI